MSHIADINLVITDLPALKAAITELGATWHEGQKTYKWFGQPFGRDWKPPEGFTLADCGKCEHAIRLPGCEYEIGVVRKKDGSGYTLLYDHWGYDRPNGDGTVTRIGGAQLHEHFGVGLPKIKQYYGLQKATIAARARGYMVQRKKVPGGIKLVVTGV